MSPYRVDSRGVMAGIRRNKGFELGLQPVVDGPASRERRAAMIGSLPDRIEAGVVEDFGAERLLDAGAKPPFPHFAARVALGLIAIGLLSLFF